MVERGTVVVIVAGTLPCVDEEAGAGEQGGSEAGGSTGETPDGSGSATEGPVVEASPETAEVGR